MTPDRILARLKCPFPYGRGIKRNVFFVNIGANSVAFLKNMAKKVGVLPPPWFRAWIANNNKASPGRCDVKGYTQNSTALINRVTRLVK